MLDRELNRPLYLLFVEINYKQFNTEVKYRSFIMTKIL